MLYENLFSECRIGAVIIKNRVVMPPMEVGMANPDGTPSEQLIAYYEERARSGIGLLITGITRVNARHGAVLPRQLSMTSDDHIKPFAHMVDRVHAHGTKIFCQLHHPGRQSNSLMIEFWPMMELIGRLWPGYWKHFFKMAPAMQKLSGTPLVPSVVAPSAVACEYSKQKTRALKKWEIRGLVNDFIRAAYRVLKTGADGIELHAAHGYLIQQFLSPYTNRRKDEYGGSLENRMRFLLEIIRGIRDKCEQHFPIVVRLSVDEFYRCINKPDQGIELAEGVEMARRLEKAGVDAIDVSSGNYETMNYWLEPMSYEPGWRSNLAMAVKENVSIPILAANLIRSADQAETQIREGIQDFVCLGRPHLADPEWTRKVGEGHEEGIKRCINCLWCFESLAVNALAGKPLECAVNPRLGRERKLAHPQRDGEGRVVAIIGAGPAGLAAAEIAGLRGFKPIVLEQNAFVGGQLQLANKAPKKEKINWCFTDLHHAAVKNGADIRFNTEATPETIKALDPYAVIVATGGRSIVPPIDGASQPHVCTVTEILNGKVKLKGKRVAVIGSGLSGLETAEKLAEDGNRIVVVEMMKKIGPDANTQNLDDVMMRLADYKVEYLPRHKLVSITPDSVILENTKNRRQREEKIDHVVLSMGVISNDKLAKELHPYYKRIYTVGDARKVGRIANAVRDGFKTAWRMK
ncbi:MAG TPA: FAD-dependent oxidoreductase [Smithella sp.]|nr:FAD-dependent oxidoreductase [Smithella sp.]